MGSDSSSSSDSDSSKDHKKKDKKEKKDKGGKHKSGDKKDKKDKKKKDHDGKTSNSGGHGATTLPGGIALPTSIAGFATAAVNALTKPGSREIPSGDPSAAHAAPITMPSAAAPSAPISMPTTTVPPTGGAPPQGFRIAIDPATSFPSPATFGPHPFTGAAGEPVFIGSAVLGEGAEVQPCKIVPSLGKPCRVLVNGAEAEHAGK